MSHLAWPEPETAPHQPWRGVVAGVEALVVVGLGVVAWWLWDRGTPLSSPVEGRPDLLFHGFDGPWVAGAVGAAALAGLVLVDAVRQAVLAVRTRPGAA
ncbi:hypothetical protein [Actinokineospora bangkokensis]|uniref:ABC transporter permease n=1 Tax=Actinokineospora bangkokensis TaxID=1193682 RepID=A0A1Q9LGM7_9PSEU|nr:hypothetical protein [Actinokineospora bangkokensis]OLR91164.1 hypothetical protein BJP25_29520 [Actinokineospora bangkokensis]